MEKLPTELVQMFDKLHTAQAAAASGSLDSSHYHEVDCAIVEALEQLSPVFVESAAAETKQGELPAVEPVDPDSAKKLQTLVAQHEGPLRNLVQDRNALGVLTDLFPFLERDQMEEMLATMENVREDVSELGNQDAVRSVSGGDEAKVQIMAPGVIRTYIKGCRIFYMMTRTRSRGVEGLLCGMSPTVAVLRSKGWALGRGITRRYCLVYRIHVRGHLCSLSCYVFQVYLQPPCNYYYFICHPDVYE